MKLISKSAKQSLQLCLLTVLLIILAFPAKGMAQTVFAGGTGEEGNPYLITTEEQLKEIANGLDKHYKLTKDISLTGTWTPIGVFTMSSPAFAGTIDGDGHTISNLEIDNDKNGGFVGNNNGTIKNLGLDLGENGIKSTMAIGGIAAENEKTGRIQNCYVNGYSISSKLIPNASSYAGGVCGINKGVIENCFVQVETVEINNSSTSLRDAGGIAGYQNGGTIKYCISFVGAIKHLNAQGNPSPGRLDYIAGSQYGKCTSIGNYGSYKTKITYPDRYDVTATGDKGNLWLGVLSSDAAWSYSENTLELKTTEGNKSFSFNNLDAHIYLEGEGTTENPFKIGNATDLRKLSEYTNNGFYSDTSCYVLTADIDLSNEPFTPIASEYCISRGDMQFQPFKGHFDGQGHSIENLTVNSSSGLFALIQNATIENVALINCQINSFAYNNSSYKEPNYTERTSVGTLVGADNGYSAVEGKSLISNCYATGIIQVEALEGKGISVGGIIGQLKLNSELTSCFSDVAITVNKPAEGGTSDVAVGGIVGLLGGTVKNCFAKGNITSTANTLADYDGPYVGSIVGHLDHRSSNNSWGELSSCIALSANIESTSESENNTNIVSRIGTRNAGKKNITPLSYANYGSQKVNLKLNGVAFSFVEDSAEYAAIVGPRNNPVCHLAEDGTDWKGELPSADAWETTHDGYVNLKSIATTFGLTEQIKLTDYVPFTITLSETIANGTLTADPTAVFSGDKVTITVTPNPYYQLKENSLKYNDTQIAAVDGVYSFIMPSEAVTLSATFVPDTLRLVDITTGDSLLISQEADQNWWYEVKTTETGTKALRSTNGKTPFNGVVAGNLADDKALVMGATCQSEIVFDGVTVHTFVIEQGAAVVLGGESELNYTEAQNKGGSLVAKNGATITDGTGTTIKTSAVTITAPTNGMLIVKVGNAELASGDQVTEDSKFTVTAIPSAGYETASVQVMQGTAELTATDGFYTMPGEAIAITVSFTRMEVIPSTVTVTLPALIGAATNPTAGRHEVEEGSSFSFALILDADYNQSVPQVTVNGLTLTPRKSDGKYILENIWENKIVSITGIVKNIPTDNAKIESANRIYASNGILYIQTPQPVEAYIVSLGGQLLRTLHLPAGETKVGGLSQGLYIVRLSNGMSQKVKL